MRVERQYLDCRQIFPGRRRRGLTVPGRDINGKPLPVSQPGQHDPGILAAPDFCDMLWRNDLTGKKECAPWRVGRDKACGHSPGRLGQHNRLARAEPGLPHVQSARRREPGACRLPGQPSGPITARAQGPFQCRDNFLILDIPVPADKQQQGRRMRQLGVDLPLAGKNPAELAGVGAIRRHIQKDVKGMTGQGSQLFRRHDPYARATFGYALAEICRP